MKYVYMWFLWIVSDKPFPINSDVAHFTLPSNCDEAHYTLYNDLFGLSHELTWRWVGPWNFSRWRRLWWSDIGGGYKWAPFIIFTLWVLCKWTYWCQWTHGSLIQYLVVNLQYGWYLFVFPPPLVKLGVRWYTGNILWVVNEVVWVIVVYSRDTWVNCRWWKVMLKIWMNVFELLFRHCVLRRIIKYFFFIIIFYDVLFICISKVSVIIGTVHSIDVLILVNKLNWVQFRFIYYKICFGCTWVWFVNIIV